MRNGRAWHGTARHSTARETERLPLKVLKKELTLRFWAHLHGSARKQAQIANPGVPAWDSARTGSD
eukprot:3065693-Pyramimonas_sp.AAC.1